ncbi:MAG: ATP-binding protein [Acidobacteriota bacterium]|nr:ATP-binding protein [Acidobacteriota bacterium]
MIEVIPQECLILNVDDYIPGRYARTKLLRQVGYPVIEAGSGRETLELVGQHKPILILLDVNLPDFSGFDVCKQLRGNPQTAATTILHISASSILTRHQVNGLESGADGYLVEPVEPAVLLATVHAYLRARRAEEELRKSNEELRWFSYRVGHDLNEPLRTITTYAQLLRLRLGGEQPAEVTKLLDFIAEGAIKAHFFMDGLLQYSQAAARQSDPGPVDVEGLLASVRQNLDSAIRESGARITNDPLPSIKGSDQLEYVFQNLISNAIKYRRKGVAPEIHVGVKSDGTNWLFAISDNGIGIEPQFRGQIFEIFRRLHGHDIPGSGIGLALARRIVESHGGRIWVDSEEGKGSTFYVRLPVEPITVPGQRA